MNQASVADVIETGFTKYDSELKSYFPSSGKEAEFGAGSPYNANLNLAGVALQNIDEQNGKIYAWQSGSSAILYYALSLTNGNNKLKY